MICLLTKVYEDTNYREYKITDSRMVENTYLICDSASKEILLSPHIAGKPLQDKMESVAYSLIHAVGRNILKGKKLDQVAELIFLSGGLYYQLNSGFKKRYNRVLPQCFLGIKRQKIEGSVGSFTAVATYENFESLPDKGTIIVGDTIATGATLQKGIYFLLDAYAEKKYTLENLVICSLACSVDGAILLKEIEKKVKLNFPNAKVHLFVCGELFHLMEDGTDLRYLYSDSIIPDEMRTAIISSFGSELGTKMKCAVFDWGTRCKNPKKHYHEFLEFATHLLNSKIEPKTNEVLTKMVSEVNSSLSSLEDLL